MHFFCITIISDEMHVSWDEMQKIGILLNLYLKSYHYEMGLG